MEMDQKEGTSGTREESPRLIVGNVSSLDHIYCVMNPYSQNRQPRSHTFPQLYKGNGRIIINPTFKEEFHPKAN